MRLTERQSQLLIQAIRQLRDTVNEQSEDENGDPTESQPGEANTVAEELAELQDIVAAAEPCKIVVACCGGIVTAVYANDAEVKAEVLDRDEFESDATFDLVYRRTTKDLRDIY